jgi:hypothetical protein
MALALRQAGEPGLEVFAHRQQREDHAPLRHVADAHLRQPVRGQDRQVLTIEAERAARARMVAGNGLHQRGLADAVGAHHAGDFPALGAQRDPVQDLAAAVVQGEVWVSSIL